MPRPPFILSRESERAAIDRVIRDPAKRQMLYEMVDAVLRVRESGVVTPSYIAPILVGFEATDEAVWSRAAGWLAKLHAFDSALSTSLDELSRHRSAAVRFNLCASLDRFPKEIAVAHLRRFLSDKSARIRGTVPNVAVKAGYQELIPEFETLLAEESDGERRTDLEQAIALLRGQTFERDGYQVRRLANGDIEYSG
jgi:HEAT repeat protein